MLGGAIRRAPRPGFWEGRNPLSLRLGMIDFDTSHAFEFAARLNHRGISEDQWVDGAEVVVGCPGKSIIFPERIPTETEKIKKLDFPLVESAEEMLAHKIDAVLIEGNGGDQHLDRAFFFLSKKIPAFVDKPFACKFDDARKMFDLADKAGVPLMSSSSLRYAPEVKAWKEKFQASSSSASAPPLLGAITFGPGSQHPLNPGLFNYGIHAVEMLFALLGKGCESVACSSSKHADMTTGIWDSGQIGSIRTDRPGGAYGFVTFTDRVEHVPVSTAYIYRELLKEIVGMFQTGKSPIEPAETIELIRFIEQANASAANHGIPHPIA
ncbi:Gfo/Idh/MocA family oxidoreductase [bacterium]|nr:Gfo/Idh/MocA family oxidoreductase [bacterium]